MQATKNCKKYAEDFQRLLQTISSNNNNDGAVYSYNVTN